MTSLEIKYEPSRIEDVVFNNKFDEQKINMIFKGHKTRHLLLCGANGTGKTTIANLIAEKLTNHCPNLLIEDSIEDIMSQHDLFSYFSRAHTLATLTGAKNDDRLVIIFNELDKYTGSLDRLWTVMDRMKDRLLIIITTNHPMKFEQAMRSRCEKYNFTRITPEDFLSRAQLILKNENIHLPDSDVLNFLTSRTVTTSDVRDYLAALDLILFMLKHNIELPSPPTHQNSSNSNKPNLCIVK